MYAELTTYNLTAGPQVMLCYVNDITAGIFMHTFLLMIFVIMVLGSYFMQKKTSGVSDFPVSFALGSWTTLIFSIIMRLLSCGSEPLTSNIALGILIVMSLISIIMLMTSRD